jgi:hypothetical protein
MSERISGIRTEALTRFTDDLDTVRAGDYFNKIFNLYISNGCYFIHAVVDNCIRVFTWRMSYLFSSM